MPAQGVGRTGVCIVRATAQARGKLLIEVSTIPDVEHPVYETRRPFTEAKVDDVLQVVSAFIAASVAQARKRDDGD